MPRQVLVTAALPYSNGRLHVGHIAGAYLPADTYVRYLKATGADVLFVCGSDDNGAAIELAALKETKQPADIVNHFHALQEQAFAGLGIGFDVYGGTHTPGFEKRHAELSQEFFKAIDAKGLFKKRVTTQFFDEAAGANGKYLPDRYVVGTCPNCGYAKANGDQCESCGKDLEPRELKDPKSVITGATPVLKQTSHWYLQLGQFDKPLEGWLRSKSDWRTGVLNFSLGQIKQGLPERAMTRDLEWGIPVPLDDPDAAGKVLYVWFDAPIGYVSFTAQLLENRGQPWTDYAKWWKNPDGEIVHFIGEDNTIFHALIWPAMLMAEGTYQLPKQVVANSFLNIKFSNKEDEEKISKSRGTAIWIDEFLTEHDPDPLRYYLTAIAPEGARTAYDPDDFVARNDGELLAVLGNFINRIATFAVKNYGAVVPPAAGGYDADDDAVLAMRQQTADRVGDRIDAFRFRDGLAEMMTLARAGNIYLDLKKPWVQRKTDAAAAGRTINVCLQLAKALATIMQPFLPFTARKVLAVLRLDESALRWDQAAVSLPDGHALGEPAPLIKKLKEEAPREAMKPRKVLIAGFSGFIGSHLGERLLQDGWQVVGVAREASWPPDALRELFECRCYVGDLAEPGVADRVVSAERPDAVVLASGQASVPKSFIDRAGTWAANVTAVEETVGAVERHVRRARVVQLSTSHVYGKATLDELPVTEQSPLRPASPYAESKVAAEEFIVDHVRRRGSNVIIARLFNNVGPRQNPTYAVAGFARQIAQAEATAAAPERTGAPAGANDPPAMLHVGRLDVARDFLDVRDLAAALSTLLEEGRPGQAYNIASGRTHLLTDILAQMTSLSPLAFQVEQKDVLLRQADADRVEASIERIAADTGWRPEISIETTLADTLNYWRRRAAVEKPA